MCFKVISSEKQRHLHDAAKNVGLGHRTFSRPLAGGSNTIEKTLDFILSQMGDDSTFVEYWTRQEWRSIEAHADVDEFLAKQQDSAGDNTNSSDFRFPINGHVLYLKVGSFVRGPTCVFPGRRSGKDLLKGGMKEDDDVDLVVVPAVPGRLLRFEGDFLHAVPRPADLWLLKFVQGAAKYEPEDEWGRSVILFNTWNDPPLNVPIDSMTDNDDKTCVSDSNDDFNSKKEWKEMYNFVLRSTEGLEMIDQSSNQARVPAKIWLLGNLRRRGHEMRTLRLSSPSHLADALHERSQVTHLLLNPMDV